jgi:hypothetical protein
MLVGQVLFIFISQPGKDRCEYFSKQYRVYKVPKNGNKDLWGPSSIDLGGWIKYLDKKACSILPFALNK